MRPYQLYPRGPWIDLDHVQGVDLPTFVDNMGHGGYFAELVVHFAFMDKPRVFRYECESTFDGDVLTGDIRPELNEHGWPARLHWLVAEVYVPLMKEWANIITLVHNDLSYYGYDHKRYETRR